MGSTHQSYCAIQAINSFLMGSGSSGSDLATLCRSSSVPFLSFSQAIKLFDSLHNRYWRFDAVWALETRDYKP